MGIRLIVEILDHAPEDLTSTERLVLVVIAEEANDGTRKGWPPLEVIADRTGLTVSGVESAIRRLRRRGYDIRLQVKVGKDGRPVYAYRGRQVNYKVPEFPTRHGAGAERRAARATLSDDKGPSHNGPSEKERPVSGAPLSEERPVSQRERPVSQRERPVSGAPPSPQSPQTISSSSSSPSNEPHVDDDAGSDDDDDGMDGRNNDDAKAAAEVARRIGVSPDRGRKVIDEIRHRFEPRNLTAYIAKMNAAQLRDLDADTDHNDGDSNGNDVPHYFRKPPREMKTCPRCDRAFRPSENYATHCDPCMTALLAGRKSKRQQETDEQFGRALARAEAKEAATEETPR